MTVTAKVLIASKQAANTDTTEYTTPGGTRTIIDKFTGTNVTSAVAKLTVNLVAVSGSPGLTNAIVYERSLGPGEVYTFPELIGHAMEPGGYVNVKADTASAITIRASGREIV